MILGIGTDIVEVLDLARRLERGTLLKAFSDSELAYADSVPKKRTQVLAARWAAKEAFAKAIGIGIRYEWDLTDIEVVRNEHGKPEMRIGPSVITHMPEGAQIHVSLSHTKNFAAAMVILEVD